ncbi:MAG TPA: PAS domain-containing protein [Hyphomicrobiaceae bacterium]|nr:PAS domain-containing protein [Hyphomicrobiaceae bacterium]
MPANLDFTALIAAFGDAVVVCDAEGAIILWNPGAERMFGYSEAEALGRSLDLIIPDRLRQRHWNGYHKTMATGVTRYGNDVLRVPAINKAGDGLSISFTVALLTGDCGEVTGIASVIRDETAKFQEDRKLRKRLAELEAKVQDVC